MTGDFSRGAAGFWIENEIAFPVSEVTISLNLNELLQRIDCVCDDLNLRSSVSPKFPGERDDDCRNLGSDDAAATTGGAMANRGGGGRDTVVLPGANRRDHRAESNVGAGDGPLAGYARR